jgi:hypothetical protein
MEVAAHPMAESASKRGEVAVPWVWPRALNCVKVLQFNEMWIGGTQRESEYATVPMGIGVGRK